MNISNNNSILQERAELCLEFASLQVVEEGLFPLNPFKSQRIQRQEVILELAHKLETASFYRHIEDGVHALMEAIAKRPADQRGSVSMLLTAFSSALTTLEKSEKLAAESISTGKEVATILELSLEALEIIQNIGKGYLESKLLQDAVGIFTLLTFWQQSHDQLWFYRAMGLYYDLQSDEALASADAAAAINPQQPEYQLLRSAIFTEKKEFSLAKDAVEEARNAIKRNDLHLHPDWQIWMDRAVQKVI